MVSAQTIDMVVVGFIALAAVIGIVLGAVRSSSGVLCTSIVLSLMVLGYLPLATLLGKPQWFSPRVTTIVTFGLLAVIGQLIAVLAVQRPLGPLLRLLRHNRSLRRLDHLLGVIPGALVGALLIGLILAPLAVTSPTLALSPALREAPLASALLEVDARFLQTARVQPLLQHAADSLNLRTRVDAEEVGRDLPFTVPEADLIPDPTAEAQLLELVNQERQHAGLPALVFDPALVPVGRDHAIEMFELGYFAHESPEHGDPFDRLAAAGIEYHAAGENLAFAPDILTAHRGLMNSPGHRANILSPKFGRAGIAVIRSRYHGLMVVQLFRD